MNHPETCREWIAKNYPDATQNEKRLMTRGYYAGVHAHIIATNPEAAQVYRVDGTEECPEQLGGMLETAT